MKIKPKFRIGDWVQVKALVTFFYDDNNKRDFYRNPLGSPVLGQIVGARRKFLGRHITDCDGFRYLQPEKSIVVWLVREGYLNVEREVLEKDLVLVSNLPCCYQTPWRKTNQPDWNEESKKELREIMKDVPRDSKGRWLG